MSSKEMRSFISFMEKNSKLKSRIIEDQNKGFDWVDFKEDLMLELGDDFVATVSDSSNILIQIDSQDDEDDPAVQIDLVPHIPALDIRYYPNSEDDYKKLGFLDLSDSDVANDALSTVQDLVALNL